MLIGRETEIRELNQDYKSNKSSLIAIYGRRRIGKSSLIKYYASNKPFWSFEALEGEPTSKQIDHFISQLKNQIKDEFLSQMQFKSWEQVFRYLTEKLKKNKRKQIILFDEFQWMSAKQVGLVSLLKYFWDNEWKNLNIQLILCGSIASFMIEKVIKSKALYGRIDIERVITELRPFELYKFMSAGRSLHEALKYIFVMGGIPKYFELINKSDSLEKNIARLYFTSSGYLFNDFEKIFYGQFKEHRTYEKIIRFIAERPRDLEAISIHLKMKTSGGLKRYLRNLEAARFIKAYKPIQKNKTNVIKYEIFDEYLIFYFKYVLPYKKQIEANPINTLFTSKVKSEWTPWLGIAFENFCLKYSYIIISALEISHLVEDVGPYFERKDSGGFQIDMLIKRTDKTWTICECKYYEQAVGVEVIKEVQTKIDRIKIPRGTSVEKVLITINGADPAVEKLEYFEKILTIEDLFRDA